MKSFQDEQGNKYDIKLTVGAVKRVRDLAGEDIYDLTSGEPPLANRLTTDIILFVDVIYACCKLQADEYGVSDAQFGENLAGKSISDAAEAFWAELIESFQQAGRTDQATVAEKNRQVMIAAISRGTQEMAAISVQEIVEEAYRPLTE